MNPEEIKEFVKEHPPLFYGMDYEILSDLNDHYVEKLHARASWELPGVVKDYIGDMDFRVGNIMNDMIANHNYQYDMLNNFGIKNAPRHPYYFSKADILKEIKKEVIKINFLHEDKLAAVGAKPVSFNKIYTILNKFGNMYLHYRSELL